MGPDSVKYHRDLLPHFLFELDKLWQRLFEGKQANYLGGRYLVQCWVFTELSCKARLLPPRSLRPMINEFLPGWGKWNGEPPVSNDKNHNDSVMVNIFLIPMICQKSHLVHTSFVFNFLQCFLRFNTLGLLFLVKSFIVYIFQIIIYVGDIFLLV